MFKKNSSRYEGINKMEKKKITNKCYNCASKNKFSEIKFDKIIFNLQKIFSVNHIIDQKKKKK